MSKLFEEDDGVTEENLKINDNYAKNYNSWRQKEELNKLKTKHGEHLKDLRSSDESESSSDDEEDENLISEKFEKDFYKTLAYLKKKDPAIYDEKIVFFPESNDNEDEKTADETQKKTKKDKPLYLRDYERKIIIENNGKLSDSDEENDFHEKTKSTNSLTYVEEQRRIKDSIKSAVDDNEDTDLFEIKTKTETEKAKEEENYREWLKGDAKNVKNVDTVALKPLRDFWSDPSLNADDKFLRDYILNKKFLDNTDDDAESDHRVHDSDDNLSADEENIEKQQEFERKYNFRFEEPDPEFIKRYPRTMDNTLRKKDTRRAEKRAEVKKRKEEEKLRQREELKQLKALKRKEIMDKLAQLKEITGNNDMNLDSMDLEGDFDPAEHDRRMQELFNDDYYQAESENVKPEFPDMDRELEIETTWDNYDPKMAENDVGPHCEDEDFNMDAEYDPVQARNQLEEEIGGSRRKRKRRSKFAELISKEKPEFNPKVHTSFKDYIDQYYALDYEDMIGDLPCRFKYRSVVPNDYGLSTEEILMADERELNKWCSLKKALEHKSEQQEMREVQMYKQKAQQEQYKMKILPSLYKPEEEEEENKEGEDESAVGKKKPRRKKKKASAVDNSVIDAINDAPLNGNEREVENNGVNNLSTVKNLKKMSDKKNSIAVNGGVENVENKSEIEMKKRQKKAKKQEKPVEDKNQPQISDNSSGTYEKIENLSGDKLNIEKKNKKRKRKLKSDGGQVESSTVEGHQDIQPTQVKKRKTVEQGDTKVMTKKMKRKMEFLQRERQKNQKKTPTDAVVNLSDERLKAYGLNPRKFKNKLKYKPSK